MTKTKIVRFYEYGNEDVLRFEEATLNEVAENEVRIEHKAIGVNFIDSYFRKGLYKTDLPSSLGTEASGVITQVGSKVLGYKVGDRVVYAQGPLGSYSISRNIKSDLIVKIPDDVSFEDAASVLLKGLTVYYLFRKVYKVSADEQILFHAAAGGVGLIACQWARYLGVKLIGTASSDEKCRIAREQGAWEMINYKSQDIVSRVKEITKENLLPVVYDGVGASTWEASLDCLKMRGLMVSFGNASGAVSGVSLSTLAQKGSLFVTRPILAHYITNPHELQQAAHELFELVRTGVIKLSEQKRYPLSQVVDVHKKLNDHQRIGGMLLIP